MFGFLMVSELVVVGIITFECLPEYRLIHSMLTNLVTGKITHALVSEGERAEEKQDLLADSSGHHSFAQKHHYRQQQHTEKCIGKGDVNSRQSIDFSNEEAWDNYDFAYEDDYPKKDDLDFESWKDDAMLDGVDFHSALGGDKIV